MSRRSTQSRSYRTARTIALTLALAIVPARAHAYTDPGSGALIWQGLMAACVGGLIYVRRFVQALRRRRGGEQNPVTPKDSAETGAHARH